jgi:hypothetical protein
MIRAFAILAILAAAAPAHAVPRCDTGPIGPLVAHGDRIQIAGSGGVIVASGEALPDWRFRIVNRVVRPIVSKLAPGLAIYHPPRPLAGVDVVLENAHHEVVERTELTLGALDPVLSPPRVRSVVARADLEVAVAVESLPRTAVAAVISRVDGAKLTPLSWELVRFGDPNSLLLWRNRSTCEGTIAGLIEPKPGMRVVVTWVDELGRVSEPSEPVVITGGSKRK